MAVPLYRLVRRALVPSSSRLININPRRQNLFSLQWRRNYDASEMRQPAYKEHLLRLFRYEILYEQDHSPPKIPPSRYYVYSIDDRPGEQWICLRTKFLDDEEVKIEATMVDKEVTIPGTKNGGPLDEVDPHISCVVNIFRGGGDVLEITCSAWPDCIELTKLFVRRDGALPANIYDGPEIKELDKRLVYADYDFLDERGIDNEFAVFLHEYMENKRKAEYIRWMGRIKSHVEQDIFWGRRYATLSEIDNHESKTTISLELKLSKEEKTMFRARAVLYRPSLPGGRRHFCDKITTRPTNAGSEKGVIKYEETYEQLNNLDFVTASKILFSDSSPKKEFGFDFHLVQFFFACMPSLAVYLVAQYARSEMRRMDAELDERTKKEEEEKAKEMERKAMEDRERYLPEISNVQSRLVKLEETVKEIEVLSKKQQSGGSGKDQHGGEKKSVAPRGHDAAGSNSQSSRSREGDNVSREKS